MPSGDKKRLDVIISVKDNATRGLKAVNRGLTRIRAGIRATAKAVFSLRAAFTALAIGFVAKRLVDAANEQAKAVAGMETALRSMGKFTPQLSKDLQNLASAMQSVTNFGDEATLQGIKFLVTYRNISDELLQRSTVAMLDLAALMRGDVVAAANTLGKASQGLTGELARQGITIEKGTFQAGGYVAVLEQIESQVAGQARAQRRATGDIIAIGNAFGDVQEKLGEFIKASFEVVGSDLIAFLDALNDSLQEILDAPDFKKNMTEIGLIIADVTAFIIQSGALIIDAFNGIRLIIEGLKLTFHVLGDAVTSVLAGIESGLASFFRFIGAAGIAETLEKDVAALQKLSNEHAIAAGEAIDNINRISGDGELAFTKAGKVIDKLRAKVRQLAADVKDTPPIVREPKFDFALFVAEQKSAIARLRATSETAIVHLNSIFEQGNISLEGFFASRRSIINANAQQEIEELQRQAEAAKTASEALGIEDKIFARREKLNRDLLNLDIEKGKKEDEFRAQELDKTKILEDLKLRAATDKGDLLTASFQKELSDLDFKHSEEIQKLRDLRATETEINEAYRAQEIEKTKLLADQERQVLESRLEFSKQIADGLSGIFDAVFELGGKKQKEFFILSKAAALASAIINTAQGVTKALAQGGFLGIAQAAVVGAKGAISIAKISAQTIGGAAEGGIIAGKSMSPKADDKLVRVTSGEFVHPVSSVRHYGTGIMEAIRKKAIPREVMDRFSIPGSLKPRGRFQEGGEVTAATANPTGGEGFVLEANIFNINDERDFERQIASAKGKNAILNFMGSNRQTIRRLIR